MQSPTAEQAGQAPGKKGLSLLDPAQGWGREQVTFEDPF